MISDFQLSIFSESTYAMDLVNISSPKVLAEIAKSKFGNQKSKIEN